MLAMNDSFWSWIKSNQNTPTLSLWLVGVVFCWFWLTQFIQLMLMAENDFPRRNHKRIWAAAFFIAFFIAPFAFCGWKLANFNRIDKVSERKSHA